MKTFVKELQNSCTEYPLQKKVVVVDSHLVGQQINEAFLQAGGSALNLQYETIRQLAHSVVEENSPQGKDVLDLAEMES